jgi:intracellular multiplication protein IcmD
VKKFSHYYKKGAKVAALFSLFYASVALADTETLGALATGITQSFSGIAKLVTAGAFLMGLGFAVGAVLKFKAHKDNPQQIPVGTPIALLFVAAALMFLPTLYGSVGVTVFGSGAEKGGLTGTTNF